MRDLASEIRNVIVSFTALLLIEAYATVARLSNNAAALKVLKPVNFLG